MKIFLPLFKTYPVKNTGSQVAKLDPRKQEIEKNRMIGVWIKKERKKDRKIEKIEKDNNTT